MLKKIAGGGVITAAAAYFLFIRPWHLRWGATDEEVQQTLSGDELIPNPRIAATHAITIKARAADIWPWVVQIGQGRGGLYSYDWIEKLMGLNIENTDRILPEFQQLKVGDVIRLGPQGPEVPVTAIEPNHLLLLGGNDPVIGGASWVFWLHQLDEQHTRLTVRLRASFTMPPLVAQLFDLLLEPIHFIMERKMLLGIKQRAERVNEAVAESAGATPHSPS